jgi:hypothetical protein
MTNRRAPKTVVAAFRSIINQHNLHLSRLINDHWIAFGINTDWSDPQQGKKFQESESNMIHANNKRFKAALQELAIAAGLESEYDVIKLEEVDSALDKERGNA